MEDDIEEKELGFFGFLARYVNNIFVSFIKDTPEQIGAFIMEYGKYGDLIIVDLYNFVVITTEQKKINKCINLDYYYKYLYPIIVELETGKREIRFSPYSSIDETKKTSF